MSIQSQINALENEINSITTEITPLQIEHDRLARQVATFEADHKHKNLSKPNLPPRQTSPLGARTALTIDLEDAPPLIYSSYFHESIRKHFSENSHTNISNTSIHTSSTLFHPDKHNILASIQLKTSIATNTLAENIWRFGGISAFPLNASLYDKDENALLGLRFDVLSHLTSRYLDPHYIILRRRVSSAKVLDSSKDWHIFRYTTPLYVPLDKYAHLLAVEPHGLQSFVERVRDRLVSIQYKHDKFVLLESEIFPSVFPDVEICPISKVVRDLDCTNVCISITVPFWKNPFQIDLTCDDWNITSVSLNLAPEKLLLHTQSILQGSHISTLVSALTRVLLYMKSET